MKKLLHKHWKWLCIVLLAYCSWNFVLPELLWTYQGGGEFDQAKYDRCMKELSNQSNLDYYTCSYLCSMEASPPQRVRINRLTGSVQVWSPRLRAYIAIGRN